MSTTSSGSRWIGWPAASSLEFNGIIIMLYPLRNRYFLASDVLLIPLAVYLSYLTRLDTLNLKDYWWGFSILAIASVILTCFLFWQLGLYARHWYYASIEELGSLLVSAFLAVSGATVITLSLVWLLPIQTIFPRSVPLISFLFLVVVTAGPRLLIRFSSHRHYQRLSHDKHQAREKIGIMGAGDAGVMIARELKHNPHLGLEIACFFDDDSLKHNMQILGIPVLGGRREIPSLTRFHGIKTIIIAMPTASGREIREIVQICETAGVKTKIIPGIFELIDGSVTVNQLRSVEIEDLLRREPVKTDTSAIQASLQGKRVLVTGAGGSIGSELCRQIIRNQPAQLILLGHGENSIFTILQELRHLNLPPVDLIPVIADIRFPDRLFSVFEKHHPEIVFHAAAHKHVPLMELNVADAVTNNILGTRNLLEASLATGTESFIMISTDKAVNPTSIMGVTKRVAELLVHQAARRSGRPYAAVRFGNVLGSRGSVVLTFKNQIARGGPVTVTHPEMTRYFMTIPEAVQLVLQARVQGVGGEVFVLDMGQPVRIVDLARDLIQLSGLEVGRDIDIVFTGVRPGEKLFEELFVDGENHRRTSHEKIFIAKNAGSLVPENLEDDINQLSMAAYDGNDGLIYDILGQLVPEYQVVRTARE